MRNSHRIPLVVIAAATVVLNGLGHVPSQSAPPAPVRDGLSEAGADPGDVAGQRVRRLGAGGARAGWLPAPVSRCGAHGWVSFPAGSFRTPAMSEARDRQVARCSPRRRTPSGVRR